MINITPADVNMLALSMQQLDCHYVQPHKASNMTVDCKYLYFHKSNRSSSVVQVHTSQQLS